MIKTGEAGCEHGTGKEPVVTPRLLAGFNGVVSKVHPGQSVTTQSFHISKDNAPKPAHLPALKLRNADKWYFRYQEDACPEGILAREVF
jgi:hypothetical protein